MSWLLALGNIERRAAASSLRCAHKRPLDNYNRLASPRSCSQPTRAENASSCGVRGVTNVPGAALLRVSDTWQGALGVFSFSQSGLEERVKPAMWCFPPLLAAQCVAVLLEAGKGEAAVELLRTWAPEQSEGTTVRRGFKSRTKVRISRQLRKAVKTLGVIGDVITLRALIAVLHESMLTLRGVRQGTAAYSSASKGAAGSCCEESRKECSRFIHSLGHKRTRVLLVEATHELVRQNESNVALAEKLTWINMTSLAVEQHGGKGPPIIPYELQNDFKKHIECSSSYDEKVLILVGSVFTGGFIGPTQSDLLHLLRTPRSEMLWVRNNDAVGRPNVLRTVVKDLPSQPSELIQNSFLVASLINAMFCARKVKGSWRNIHRKVCELPPIERQLRSIIWTQLESMKSSQRRLWSRSLLRHPRVMCRLDMSPIVVFGIYALTFRSRSSHFPFLRGCLLSMQRMYRQGREEEAARIVWNHISGSNHVLPRYCSHRPFLLEKIMAALCRTMRRGILGRRESWMGHRSLAVLRLSVPSGQLTPGLCIPLCAAALDCGVHFATVRQHVLEIYEGKGRTGLWVLNMVRLIADCHIAPMRVAVDCPLHSARLRGLVRRVTYEMPTLGSVRSVEVHVPSRSKLLALWSIVNDVHLSEPLRRLSCLLFLDPLTLDAFKQMRHELEQHECDHNVADGSGGKRRSSKDTLNFLLYDEVFVSVAINCTTPISFSIFMDAFVSRQATHGKQRYLQLMLSE